MEPEEYLALVRQVTKDARDANRQMIEGQLDAIDRSLGVLAARGIIEDAKKVIDAAVLSGGNV